MAFRTVFRNTAFLFVVQVTTPLASLLLISLISRKMGAEGLGVYSFVLAVQFVASTAASLGLNIPITRAVAQDRSHANRYLCSGLAIGLVAATGLVVFANLLVNALHYPPTVETAVFIAALSIFPVVALFYTEAVFLAFERTEFIAGLSLGENLLRVVLGLVLIQKGYGLIAFFAVVTSLKYAVLAGQLLFLHRFFFRLRWEFNPVATRALLRAAPTFSGIVAVNSVYSRVDTFFLSKLQTMHAVGVYDAGFRLLFLSMTLPYSLSRAAYPAMCEAVATSTESIRQVYERSLKYAMIMVAPIALGTAVLGQNLIVLLYGNAFADSVLVLRILILGLLPAAVMRVNGSLLFSMDREKIDFQVNLAVTAANVLLNWILITYYGYLGACLTTVGCFCLYVALQQAYIQRRLFEVRLLRVVWRPVAAAAVMAVCVWPARSLFPAIPIALGGCVYAICLVLVRAVSKEDLFAMAPRWRSWNPMLMWGARTAR